MFRPEGDHGALVRPGPDEVVLTGDCKAEDSSRHGAGSRGWKYSSGDVDDLDKSSNTSGYHEVVVTRQEPTTCQGLFAR